MTPYQTFPKEFQCFPSQQCTSDYKRCNAPFKNWISVVRIIRRLHFFVQILWLCKWFPYPQVIINFSSWVHCCGCCFIRKDFNIVVCVKALRRYLNFTPETFISLNDAFETPLIELQHPDSTQIWVNIRLRRPPKPSFSNKIPNISNRRWLHRLRKTHGHRRRT